MAWQRVVDNRDSSRFYSYPGWNVRTDRPGYRGINFEAARPDYGNAAWFRFPLPRTSDYDVWIWHPRVGNSRMPFGVYSPTHPNALNNGYVWKRVDLRTGYGKWKRMGRYRIPGGDYWVAACSRYSSAPGLVAADAVLMREVESIQEAGDEYCPVVYNGNAVNMRPHVQACANAVHSRVVLPSGKPSMFSTYPDHQATNYEYDMTRAIDYRMGNWREFASGDWRTLGNEVRDFLINNAAEFKTGYVIWWNQIYGDWNGFRAQDYGASGATPGHYDHVHSSHYL